MIIHFLRPELLILVLPLLLLWWAMFYFSRTAEAWRGVCDPHLLPHILDTSIESRQRIPLYLLGFGWLLAVIAMAGPCLSKTAEALYRAPFARVIILDLSPSMLTRDLVPDRLTRAKYKLLDILRQTNEGQTGLLVFSGEAHSVSPLTHDAATLAAMVPVLGPDIMPVQGQAMAQALKKAGQMFQQAGVPSGNIVLITGNPAHPDSVEQVRWLKKAGISTSVLAMGTMQTMQAFSSLQTLAAVGGGRYQLFTQSSDDIDALLESPSSADELTSSKKTEEKAFVWHDQGDYLLIPLLFIALFAFRRGWMEKIGS